MFEEREVTQFQWASGGSAVVDEASCATSHSGDDRSQAGVMFLKTKTGRSSN